MRIALLFPSLPPALDGIGDYTARLSTTLAEQHEVSVWTTPPSTDNIPNVRVVRGVSFSKRSGPTSLVATGIDEQVDWVVLQYNPFSYGHWGLNLNLAPAIRRLKTACPSTRVGLMVHEPFVPVTNWRWAIQTTWQRWQLWQLGRAADALFFSIVPWVERFRSWFPDTLVRHLPVGSNIPHCPSNRQATRRKWGGPDDACLLGIFGTAHHTRLLPFIREAAQAASDVHPDVRILYVGPHGTEVRRRMHPLPILDAGALPAAEVSHQLSAMDVFLSPFEGGVSARRGSFLAGIQHGLATLSTHGPHTDAFLHDANGTAVLLSPDDDPAAFARNTCALIQDDARRTTLGKTGRQFFEQHFTWSRIGDLMLETFDEVCAPSASLT